MSQKKKELFLIVFFFLFNQERDIRVVGGLLWWQEFIVCGCTSTSENRDEVRKPQKEKTKFSI